MKSTLDYFPRADEVQQMLNPMHLIALSILKWEVYNAQRAGDDHVNVHISRLYPSDVGDKALTLCQELQQYLTRKGYWVHGADYGSGAMRQLTISWVAQ